MPKAKARGFVTRGEVKVERMPWGPYEWLSRSDIVDTEQLLMARVRLVKGQGHDFHRHPGMEEAIYILEGQAEQWIGDEMKILGPGEVAHIPRNVVHATFHHSTGPLRFLMVLGPAKFKGPALVDASGEEPWVSLRSRKGQLEKRSPVGRLAPRERRTDTADARLAPSVKARRRRKSSKRSK